MKTVATDIVDEVRDRLLGLECWYASAGGSHVGGSFSLALGDRVPREVPLANTAHSDEYRKYEGEANLLVWCTWRLDSQSGPLSSSDDAQSGIQSALSRLVGAKVVDVAIARPGWDLRLVFAPFHSMQIFCDHVPGDPSFDGNWELHAASQAYYFGPGAKLEIESR